MGGDGDGAAVTRTLPLRPTVVTQGAMEGGPVELF
jgi:hypothetical protein